MIGAPGPTLRELLDRVVGDPRRIRCRTLAAVGRRLPLGARRRRRRLLEAASCAVEYDLARERARRVQPLRWALRRCPRWVPAAFEAAVRALFKDELVLREAVAAYLSGSIPFFRMVEEFVWGLPSWLATPAGARHAPVFQVIERYMFRPSGAA